jgi:hypothetical protein
LSGEKAMLTFVFPTRRKGMISPYRVATLPIVSIFSHRLVPYVFNHVRSFRFELYLQSRLQSNTKQTPLVQPKAEGVCNQFRHRWHMCFHMV